jgi:hypothetical protein
MFLVWGFFFLIHKNKKVQKNRFLMEGLGKSYLDCWEMAEPAREPRSCEEWPLNTRPYQESNGEPLIIECYTCGLIAPSQQFGELRGFCSVFRYRAGGFKICNNLPKVRQLVPRRGGGSKTP